MGKTIARIALSPISALVSVVDKRAGAFLFQAISTAAAFIPGAGPFISAGLNAANSLTGAYSLGGRRSQTTRTNADRLRASVNPRAPRVTAWGETALATDVRDEEFTGNQEFLHRWIVVAAHRVQAINEIWFDDELAWSLAGGVTSKYTGYLLATPILEGSAANAINISARMGSSRRYTGCAYVYLRYKLTGNSRKAESPFAQGITSRITIRGSGAPAYDPRQDSTVPGGSGAHRADNQATWTWGAHCRNPAIALLNYLLGWRINGELSVGKGIPKARIDLESFAVGANICDELVAKPGGGTEPRYRCDGVWSEGDNPSTVIDMFKASMNADLDDMNGRLRLTVFHNDLATPVADFDDDDILSDFVWTPVAPIEDALNIVRGGYTDPSNQSLYQMVDYPQAETPNLDGIDRIDTFDLPLVQSAGQAQRLAGLRLRRNLLAGTFKCELQATGWRIEKNSILRLSFLPRGWVNKLFRVMEMDLRQDGVVPVVLREEDPDLYDDGGLLSPISALEPTPFNYQLDPAYQVLTTVTRNVPRGIYSGTETYIEGDQVVFSGSTYQLTVASSTGNPPPDVSRWILVAAAGSGTPGAAGAPGYSVLVSNEAHTIATAADGSGGSYSNAGGTMRVIRGTTVLSPVFSIAAATPGTGWITIDSATGVYTVTDPGVDLATATLRAVVDGITFDRTYTIAKSKQGVSSPIVQLSADRQGFTFLDNVADPASQTITLTAALQGLAGPAVFTTSPVVPLSGTGNTRTLAIADFGAARQVTVTATVGALSDRITIVRIDRSSAEAGATVGAPQGTAVGGVPVEVGYSLTPTGMFEDWNRHGTLLAAQRAWDFDNPAALVLATDGNMSGGWTLQATGSCSMIGKHRIAYAYEDLYRIKARVFVSAVGSGNTHLLGITAFNASGAELTSVDSGFLHYFGGYNAPTATGFYEWEGYFRGRAAVGTGANVGIPATDPSAPNPVAAGAVTIAPVFLANNGGTGGQVRVDYIAIEKVEDLAALPSRPWAAGDFQKRGQVVTYLGRSWIARIDNTGVAPPATSAGNATWGLLADRGTDGADGADGAGTLPAYRRSATQPATPAPSSGIPAGWFASTGAVPAGPEPMWVAIGTRPNSASNWTWPTPTRFEAVSAVGTGDWQYVTETPSPELTFALGPGESRIVNARVFYPAPTGPGTVAVQIEFGEVGGSWSASSGPSFAFNAGEPAAAAHSVTVTNSTGVTRAYRARATSVVTGSPGARDAQSSVVRV